MLLIAVVNGQINDVSVENSNRDTILDGLRTSSSLEFYELRQGTEEYAQILLYGEGRFAIVSPDSRDPRVKPTEMEIQLPRGFHVSVIRYPHGTEKRFAFDATPVRVLKYPRDRDRLSYVFKVGAGQDVPPGEYTLKARIPVRIVNDGGISQPRFLDTEVPITVVNHKAKVNSFDRSIGGLRGIKAGEWAAIVLLLPVSVPLSVLMLLTGWDGC
jgi:hypothetical protein